MRVDPVDEKDVGALSVLIGESPESFRWRFLDPSGNVIELYCDKGFAGAECLPHGPPRGHGTAVDIDALYYDTWSLPA